MLQVCVKYSMCDQICDVINSCVGSYDCSKINVHDNITIERRENMKINDFYINIHLIDGLRM